MLSPSNRTLWRGCDRTLGRPRSTALDPADLLTPWPPRVGHLKTATEPMATPHALLQAEVTRYQEN